VVTPEWLIESNFKWEKCDESQFKLTKEYEYKHCAFHQEYNSQQKFTTNAAAASNAAKISADGTFLASTLNKNNSSSNNLRESSENTNNSNGKFQKNESSHSLSSFETRTKKPKTTATAGDETTATTSTSTKKSVTFDLDDATGSESSSNSQDSNLIQSLNEDIFQQMDREVSYLKKRNFIESKIYF
jgi:hypothetical protein